jgi:hypothetical protein
MQRLVVEYQIQFAHVLEQPVQRLDVHLDQVDQRQRGLGRRRDDDEVKGGIVAVGDERGDVVLVLRGGGARRGGGEEGWEGQEVAGTWGAVGDEGEDFGYEALLD